MSHEWVAVAISGIAALTALAALTLSAALFRQQYRALKATTETLTEELLHLREERARNRRAQAVLVQLHAPQEGPAPDDEDALQATFAREGINDTWKLPHVEVTNLSSEPIRDLQVTVDDAGPPARYVTRFDDRPRAGTVVVLPAKESVRVYWKKGFLRSEMTSMEFTDEAGLRWRRPFQGPLVEVTGPA